MDMSNVNVEEGFLPKFTKEFLSHYGADSIFVRTLSDCYTYALVKVMQVNQMSYDANAVATFSNKEAADLLSGWISSVEGAKQLALQEAMGIKPIGSLESLVDETLGKGRFREWLAWLQEKK
jgi:hypothetical protein